MEQTKAKTAEEILCQYLGEYWWIMGKYRRPAINAVEKFAHQKTTGLQSHIANLEAEKSELMELMGKQAVSIAELLKENGKLEEYSNTQTALILEAQNKELREALEED